MSQSRSTPVETASSIQTRPETHCPECSGPIQSESDERYCGDCGLILSVDRIDHGPEWRILDTDDRERTGAPRTQTRHDRGLGGTVIGYRDSKGRAIDSARLSRMRRIQSRSRYRTKAERNLRYALGEVGRLAEALGQGDGICEQACSLARSAQQANLFLGRSMDSMAAAALLGTLRVNGLPFAASDIAPHARCGKSAIRQAYRVLNEKLGLPTPPPTATAVLPRIASEANVSEEITSRALGLTKQLDQEGLISGKSPSAVAGAALYVEAKRANVGYFNHTQQRLAKAAGCVPPTIRNNVAYIHELIEAGEVSHGC